jgi:hypothetical protein
MNDERVYRTAETSSQREDRRAWQVPAPSQNLTAQDFPQSSYTAHDKEPL